MKKYKVTWGELSQEVYAPTEADAWSAFVDAHDLAQRHPNLHEHTVEELPEAVEDEVVVEDEFAAEESPVVNENADIAIDSIRRMRSVEKLQEIVATDTRRTVTEAAQRRLDELAGS